MHILMCQCNRQSKLVIVSPRLSPTLLPDDPVKFHNNQQRCFLFYIYLPVGGITVHIAIALRLDTNIGEILDFDPLLF